MDEAPGLPARAMRATAIVVAIAATLVAVGCGGGDKGQSTSTPRASASITATRAAATATIAATQAVATNTAGAPATTPAAAAAVATSVPASVPTQAAGATSAAAAICASNAMDVAPGSVQAPELTEISGMALSRQRPGVIWAHNDSGDTARVFALDPSGTLLATYNLPGVTAIDWEDMAIGDTARADDLYLGDIGDNLSVRPAIVVYRLAPDPLRDGPGAHDVAFTAIRLTYPDGAHDAETLMFDPATGDLIIVTKDISGGPSGVYALHDAAFAIGSNVLEKVGEIPFGSFVPAKVVPEGSPPLPSALPKVPTGGDTSPSGDVIAIRTYGTVWVWSRAPGQSIADALAAAPCEGPSAVEAQGEAIAFDADGGGYWTASEGANVPLHHFRWQP